jgi:hypothetical protein
MINLVEDIIQNHLCAGSVCFTADSIGRAINQGESSSRNPIVGNQFSRHEQTPPLTDIPLSALRTRLRPQQMNTR